MILISSSLGDNEHHPFAISTCCAISAVSSYATIPIAGRESAYRVS